MKNPTYTDYWQHVESLACEIVEQCHGLDEITEAIYSRVDGDSWIVWTRRAVATLKHTENAANFFAQGMSLDGCADADDICSTLAHYALLGDVTERVYAMIERTNRSLFGA